MTATESTTWTRCNIAVAYRDDNPREWHVVPEPGHISGNIGVRKTDHVVYPWRLHHQPSGIPFGQFRTLRGAKQFVRAFRERFDPTILDRAADGDLFEWRTISQIKALARQFEAI